MYYKSGDLMQYDVVFWNKWTDPVFDMSISGNIQKTNACYKVWSFSNSIGDLFFSDDNGLNWDYTPVADIVGLDCAVSNFKIDLNSVQTWVISKNTNRSMQRQCYWEDLTAGNEISTEIWSYFSPSITTDKYWNPVVLLTSRLAGNLFAYIKYYSGSSWFDYYSSNGFVGDYYPYHSITRLWNWGLVSAIPAFSPYRTFVVYVTWSSYQNGLIEDSSIDRSLMWTEDFTSIDSDSFGNLYVSFSQWWNLQKTSVIYNTWFGRDYLGSAGFSSGPANHQSTYIDSQNEVFVGFTEWASSLDKNIKISVMKYDSSLNSRKYFWTNGKRFNSWDINQSTRYASLVISNSGEKYVWFSEHYEPKDNYQHLSVMKYETMSDSWKYMTGSKWFATWVSPKLAVRDDWELFISSSEWRASIGWLDYRNSVMKYNKQAEKREYVCNQDNLNTRSDSYIKQDLTIGENWDLFVTYTSKTWYTKVWRNHDGFDENCKIFSGKVEEIWKFWWTIQTIKFDQNIVSWSDILYKLKDFGCNLDLWYSISGSLLQTWYRNVNASSQSGFCIRAGVCSIDWINSSEVTGYTINYEKVNPYLWKYYVDYKKEIISRSNIYGYHSGSNATRYLNSINYSVDYGNNDVFVWYWFWSINSKVWVMKYDWKEWSYVGENEFVNTWRSLGLLYSSGYLYTLFFNYTSSLLGAMKYDWSGWVDISNWIPLVSTNKVALYDWDSNIGLSTIVGTPFFDLCSYIYSGDVWWLYGNCYDSPESLSYAPTIKTVYGNSGLFSVLNYYYLPSKYSFFINTGWWYEYLNSLTWFSVSHYLNNYFDLELDKQKNIFFGVYSGDNRVYIKKLNQNYWDDYLDFYVNSFEKMEMSFDNKDNLNILLQYSSWWNDYLKKIVYENQILIDEKVITSWLSLAYSNIDPNWNVLRLDSDLNGVTGNVVLYNDKKQTIINATWDFYGWTNMVLKWVVSGDARAIYSLYKVNSGECDYQNHYFTWVIFTWWEKIIDISYIKNESYLCFELALDQWTIGWFDLSWTSFGRIWDSFSYKTKAINENSDIISSNNIIMGYGLDYQITGYDFYLFTGYCGDSAVLWTEFCDDGLNNGLSGYCNNDCDWVIPLCGNWTLETWEQCDDWNIVSWDWCSVSCSVEIICWNGVVQVWEQCDDWNSVSWDWCSVSCSVEIICWNGVVQVWEQCDDWNSVSWDWCSASCSVENSSWWWGYNWWGWGVGWPTKDFCEDWDFSNSYYDDLCGSDNDNLEDEEDFHWVGDTCSVEWSTFGVEIESAYQFAYQKWITTIKDIKSANPRWPLRRDELAKMISVFTIKVLWYTDMLDEPRCNDFDDIGWETEEMQFYMKTSCYLGLMWWESDRKLPMKSFMPSELVDRAQFSTVLSRLLFKDLYNLTDEDKKLGVPWYSKHLQALNQEKVINNILDPFMRELRSFVWIMFQRVDWILRDEYWWSSELFYKDALWTKTDKKEIDVLDFLKF